MKTIFNQWVCNVGVTDDDAAMLYIFKHDILDKAYKSNGVAWTLDDDPARPGRYRLYTRVRGNKFTLWLYGRMIYYMYRFIRLNEKSSD